MQYPYVLTGGPGSGKSSLLEALRQAGCAVSPEAGRAIIRDQQAIDGQALPWRDRELFAELMLAWELRAHRRALQRQGPVFCDRGVVDVIGYRRLCGLPLPAHLENAARLLRYQCEVFVLPPWAEIYCQDAQRRQDLAEAERTCEMMCQVYRELGYRLVEVPRLPLAERRDFVLAWCRRGLGEGRA